MLKNLILREIFLHINEQDVMTYIAVGFLCDLYLKITDQNFNSTLHLCWYFNQRLLYFEAFKLMKTVCV